MHNIIRSCLAALLLTSSCALAAEDVEYFTDNGYGNPIATMQHPCGEHFDGTTYVGYQGPHEDPYVCAYHHETEIWTGPFKAGTNLMGRPVDAVTRDGPVDNHGRPAMVIDTAGYIHLVFGGHGGSSSFGVNHLGAPGRGRQTHVVSKRPGDISEWEELENISLFGTYSQLVKMGDGDIYLFYRHGSHQSDWVYQKSSDNGRTFAAPVSVLKSKPINDHPRIVDAWYAWFNPGRGDTITASYVYHPCNKAGRHTNDRFNAYYMQMNCGDDMWSNVQGDPLSAPVNKEVADRFTLIVNTGEERSNHGTCHVDEQGHPHIFFRHDEGEARYYRWTGNEWQKPVRVTGVSKSQDGDMIVESPMNVRMLLRYKSAGLNAVGWSVTNDGGLTWARHKPLMSSRKVAYNPISSMIRNAHPDARILLSEDVNGQQHQYRRLILLGDQGPVTRLASAANNVGETLARMPELAKAQPPQIRRGGGRRGRGGPGGPIRSDARPGGVNGPSSAQESP